MGGIGAGGGIAALLGTAGAGLATAGTALMGIITGAGALMTAIAVVAAPVLAAIALADMVHNAFTSDSIAEWAGKTMDHIFGPLLDFSPDELKKLGMGSLETPLTSFADTLAGVLDWYRENTLGDMWRKLTGDRRTDTEKLEGAMEGRHAASQKQGGELGELDLAGYTSRMIAKRAKKDGISISEARKLMLQERGLTVPKPTEEADETVSDEPVDAKGKNQGSGGGVAVATGTVSGKSLILEVTNWDQIHAQAVESAA
jgi:hypothetical protein